MYTAGGIKYASAGQGPALVCLHGIGGDSESFRPQLDELSDNYRVFSWNMPGYGGSEALEEVSFTSLCRALLGFLDELQLNDVVLVGQSIGGMIAQEFALRHAERVAALVLVATTSAFGGRDDSFREAFLKARLKPLDEGHTLAELAPRFVPEILGSAATEEALRAAVASMSRVPEQNYRDILKCLVTFNRWQEVASIRQPVCLIAGAQDNNAPAKTMQKMAEKMAAARFRIVPGAGHLVNLECPRETNQIIREFLSEELQ